MTGAEIAERLLTGHLTEIRLKKAAARLTAVTLPDFLKALPDDVRATVETQITPLVK